MMYRTGSLFVLALLGLAAVTASAQPAPDPAAPPAAARVRTSPHETVSTVIGDRRTGPRITITYGRPFLKDPKSGSARQIWGGVVPWGKAWRLGADEATLVITQAPLTFGSTTIPAGAYTLYLVPAESGGAQLAFSSALGKWGVPVDESRDVARVALSRHALESTLDQLTIAIEADPAGTGGVLKIAWDNTQFAAPFSVAK